MTRRVVATLVMLLTLAASAPGQANPPRDARSIEAAVELAWLADPITFPYDLRAEFRGGQLEIHGVVPAAIVRKQAVGIARLVSSAQILDQSDIRPETLAKIPDVPARDVVERTRAAIQRALPQLAGRVEASCDDNGRVALRGVVSNSTEKNVLSALMRRVAGCTSVENQVTVADALRPAPPIPFEEATAPPVTLPRNPAEEMRSAIVRLCPTADEVRVRQIAADRFHIMFRVRTDREASRYATVIFNHPDWTSYRLDIDAQVPR